jgi:hypothetical protein
MGFKSTTLLKIALKNGKSGKTGSELCTNSNGTTGKNIHSPDIHSPDRFTAPAVLQH